jgi:hypothetical protein
MHKFRKRLGLATLGSLALSLIFTLTPAAHAATNTFDGNTFSVSYIHFGASGTDVLLDTASVKYHRQSRWLEMVSASKAPINP